MQAELTKIDEKMNDNAQKISQKNGAVFPNADNFVNDDCARRVCESMQRAAHAHC